MSASNNRASLLSGLRTGGVRSVSGSNHPHTAALGGSFQVPRFASNYQHTPAYDDGGDASGQTLQYGAMNSNPYGAPMTAGHIDGRAPRFQHAQQSAMQQQQMLRQAQIAALSGLQGMGSPMDPQFLQLQLMQAMVAQQQQAQKLQAEIALQQQVALALAAQQQQTPRVPSGGSRMPMTAAPTQTSFDFRPNPMSQLRSSRMTSVEEKEEAGPVPMTAALGGKFGSRSLSSSLNPHAPSFKMAESDQSQPPPTPSTVVISGGVSLGNPTGAAATPTIASKSDSAVSWRRGSGATLPIGSRSASPPKVSQAQSTPTLTISSPEVVEKAPAPAQMSSGSKYRPQPLRFKGSASSLVPAVTIEDEDGHTVYTSGKVTTPQPASPATSNSSEGSKKYEGLGIGRPVIAPQTPSPAIRMSQPVRQPRGPPAGAEDLGMKNFAARVKRNASAPMVIAQEAVIIAAY